MTPAETDTISLQREIKWPKLDAFDSLKLCRSLGMITKEEYTSTWLMLSMAEDLGVPYKAEEVDSLILRMRKK